MKAAKLCLCFVVVATSMGWRPTCVHAGENGIAAASLFGFGALVLVDIFFAPDAATRYNRSASLYLPGLRERKLDYDQRVDFGQPEFTRNALTDEAEKSFVSVPPQKYAARKSPGAAFLWSLGATIIPLAVGSQLARNYDSSTSESVGTALVSLGLLVGPSAGHFYAGRPVRGILTTIGRVALAGLFLTTFEWDLE